MEKIKRETVNHVAGYLRELGVDVTLEDDIARLELQARGRVFRGTVREQDGNVVVSISTMLGCCVLDKLQAEVSALNVKQAEKDPDIAMSVNLQAQKLEIVGTKSMDIDDMSRICFAREMKQATSFLPSTPF